MDTDIRECTIAVIVSGILKGIAMKGFAITVRESLDILGLETLQSYSFIRVF